SRREPRADGRHDVPSGGRVGAREDPYRAREAGQPAFPFGGEETLARQRPLEAFQSRQMVAEPEPLERRRPKAQLSTPLVELRTALHMHLFAVREVELERVETLAPDRRGERGAGEGVLEREEDRAPRVVPPQLAQLALDPDLGQPAKPHADAAVERADRKH